jgi:hypothetical protein
VFLEGGKGEFMCKTKRLGDLAEAAFNLRAAEEGLQLARPLGADSRYDVIVDNGRRRLLVQVKYTAQMVRPGVYVVKAARQEHSGNRRAPKTVRYLKGEIHFVAVYLAQDKAWYILPYAALRGRKNLTLYGPPHERKNEDGKYLERWGLLWR